VAPFARRIAPRSLLALCLVAAACGTVPPAAPDGAGPDAAPDAGVDAPAGRVDPCPTAGQVGCYDFEAGAAPGRIVDGSGQGNDGAAAGVRFDDGPDGLAVVVDPAASRVVIPDADSLDVEQGSFELWARASSVVAPGAIQHLIDNNGEYSLIMRVDNRVQCMVKLATAVYVEVWTTAPLDIGMWHHIACTYDRSEGKLRIYFDGLFDAEAQAAMPAAIADEAVPLVIGGNSPCPMGACTDAFVGAIDQVRIWQWPLGARRICTHAGRDDCP